MLRVRTYSVMDRLQVVVHCTEHGPGEDHLLASKSADTDDVGPVSQLRGLEEVIGLLLRSYDRGEWEFTDEC
jgi:hypothetical protein